MYRFIAGIALGIFASTVTQALGGSQPQLPQVRHQSWQTLDAKALNTQIEAAIAAGADWPQSPVEIALQLFGRNLEELQSANIAMTKDRPEGADAATVDYIRDGFLDDSVRGDWHQVELQRLADGTWRVREAREAYRCWRGANTDAYRSNPCP